MLIAPRPDYLATSDELQASERIARLESALRRAGDRERADVSLRLARLKGALTWNLETQYQTRLTKTYEDLAALNHDIDAMTARYDSFVRTRQAATQSYTGYDRKIADLRGRTAGSLVRLADLMKRQGEMLEAVATNELKVRRERLAVQLDQARFAFADSYDRATKAQAN
jgi:chromosome segregation ATPase